jgi:hypothetical protein
MPSTEGSNPRPSGQLRTPCTTKNHLQDRPGKKKMLIYCVRSRNVYENKENIDKMPDQKSDILGKVKPVLQKISHLEGQFVLDCQSIRVGIIR